MIAHTAFPATDNRSVLIRARNGGEMEMNCTPEQYLEGLKAYRAGAMMQTAFSVLSVEEREFLISGLTPTEWNRMFTKEDSDE